MQDLHFIWKLDSLPVALVLYEIDEFVWRINYFFNGFVVLHMNIT